MNELKLEKKQMLSNYTTLCFDHPLTMQEYNNLLETLTEPKLNLTQVYFKENVNIETIETIKLLLEGLPNLENKKIEKYIMKTFEKDDLHQILSMNFDDIDNWNIAYEQDKNCFSVTSMTKFKKTYEWFDNVLLESVCSDDILDKICFLYDKVKMFDYNDDAKYKRLPEIIIEQRANSLGYSVVFEKLLSLCGIHSVIIPMLGDDYVVLAEIKDAEHNINGIYLFEPSSDTIAKNMYKNGLARKINYNFFAVTLDKYKTSVTKPLKLGLAKILTSETKQDFEHNLSLYREKNGHNELNKIENKLERKIGEIYININNSMAIEPNYLLKTIIKRIDEYPDCLTNGVNIEKTIEENYLAREKELFLHEYVKLQK